MYRFYDGREWRFCPDPDNPVAPDLDKEEYDQYRGDLDKATPFIPNFLLPFDHSDVNHIIKKRIKDIPSIMRTIERAKWLLKLPALKI